MCCSSKILLLILYLATLVYGNLEYMTRLHKKCSRKVKAFESENSHQNTQIFAKSVPLSGYEILNNELHLHWNFPLVDEELVSGLRRSKLVLTSKPFNSVDVPEIVLKSENVTLNTFTLPRPRFQEFVRFDLGNQIQKRGLVRGVEFLTIFLLGGIMHNCTLFENHSKCLIYYFGIFRQLARKAGNTV